MNRFFTFLALALCLGLAATPALIPPSDPYALLERIPLPYQLIRFPPAYRVDVELSGPVADEIRNMLVKMDLSPPHFEEVMTKGNISLSITNTDYPGETRDLISGILNPAEMIELVLQSLLKLRDSDQFVRIKKETTAQLEREVWPHGTVFRVSVFPRGTRFAYSYEDAGTVVYESWLSAMSVSIDSASLRVMKIVLHRFSRTISAIQNKSIPPDTAVLEYCFEYDSVFGNPLSLTLSVNGRTSVTIEAAYRTEKGYTVFERRNICCRRNPEENLLCLEMKYGTYTIGITPFRSSAIQKQQRLGNYGSRLVAAATLSRKASVDLRKGNISSAVRTLRNLIESYPETPQAVEAEKLLGGLP